MKFTPLRCPRAAGGGPLTAAGLSFFVWDGRTHRCVDLAWESPGRSWPWPSPAAVRLPKRGPKPYKGPNSPPIQELLKATSENMKNNSITTKGPEEKKPAGKTEKDARQEARSRIEAR